MNPHAYSSIFYQHLQVNFSILLKSSSINCELAETETQTQRWCRRGMIEKLKERMLSIISSQMKMSEKDFWTKYCRVKYLQWSGNSATVATEAAEVEDLAIFLKHDDIPMKLAERILMGRMRRVDPTLDMDDLGDDYMHLPGRRLSSVTRDNAASLPDYELLMHA